MQKKLGVMLLCMLLVLSISACKAPISTTPTVTPTPAPAQSPLPSDPLTSPTPEPSPGTINGDIELISALLMQNEQFSIRLMQTMMDGYTDRNTLFSPTALSNLMAAFYASAGGDTQEELRAMMGYTSEPEDVVRANAALLAQLSDEGFSLHNSLHMTSRVKYASTFTEGVAKDTHTALFSLDFSNQNAFASLGAQAELITDGKEYQLATDTSPSDTLYAISGFSAKLSFDFPFDKSKTSKGEFNSPIGLTAAQMMRMDAALPYAEDEYMQSVTLPMSAGKYALTLILPRDGNAQGFDEAFLQYASNWFAPDNTTEQAVSLFVPKFTLSSAQSYQDILTAMGWTSSLRPQTADLFGLVDPDLKLPTPLNDLYSVGALTFTEGGINTESTSPLTPPLTGEESVELTFDRPFLVSLTDTQTGAQLALGWVNAVVDPKKP